MHTSRFGALTRTALGAAAVLWATVGTPAAAEAAEDLLADKPLLRVTTFEQAPVLDGLLDDPCWATAAPAGPLWHFQTGAQSEHDTWAKMGIDEAYIYVAFRCAEEEMGRLEPVSLPPDSMSVYAHDHVEFFFMPDALGGPAYHFSVDIGGNRHDEIGSDGSWNCDWQAAVGLAEDHWTVEMRIPREAVGLTDPQMSLANFCRTRRLTPGETSAWSKTFGIFHNPARFGRIVYGPGGGTEITEAVLSRPRIGENRVDVVLVGGAEAADVSVEGYIGVGEEMSRFAVHEIRPGAETAGAVRLLPRVEHDTRARVVIVAREAGRVVTFCDASEVSLTGARPTPIRQVLGPEAAPFMRWIDEQRLRGISYGFGFTGKMPDDGLVRAEPGGPGAAPETLRLRGESYFRILAEAGEEVRFELAARGGDSPFTSAVWALFGPEGEMLGKGLVEAGESADVSVPTRTPGHHTLLVNSGPASWNPFSITVHSPYWALDARGKSTYLHTPVSLHSLRDARLAGMNVALMAAWLWGIPFKDDEGLARWGERLRGLCEGAQDADMRLIPYVGWGCSVTEPDAAGDYTRALTRLPVRGPHPCPISREYWERTFLRRALVVAELSTEYPAVVGVGLDPESYYFADWYGKNLETPEDKRRAWSITQPFGGSPEKCACNDCFHGFLREKGRQAPDLPEDGNARFDWIGEQGLLDDLCAYQQGELETIMRDVRQRVHEVNPDLCFAILLLSIGDNWFCRGVARGLGTSRVPVLDFDEGTYTAGYSAGGLQAKLDRYEEWDAHVVHGGCLWAMKHPPHNPHFLSAQMFNFALHGHGYWFWPGSMSVWRSNNDHAGYYSLSGYTEDYWKAIVSANREIDRRLAAPEEYRSPLEHIQQRPDIPREPAAGEKNEWAQKPWYPVHVYPGTRLSFVVPPGRESIEVLWGYRETLGERTLLVNVAGQERRLTASIEAEQVNVADLAVPGDGCEGWIEVLGSGGEDEQCVGIMVAGAKAFFGGADGMRLR